ncbi:hypothetical protein H4W31_003390 [Plantactinospora soyae]|uniref:Uncharacterized protein n=1 Tax=Plantactinospora soyae TaxID=1544732 RepID=A0A927M675_9ACTN|nr:hypothetical protein [Plantactinospora soyae]
MTATRTRAAAPDPAGRRARRATDDRGDRP